jgi:hypothetical protein
MKKQNKTNKTTFFIALLIFFLLFFRIIIFLIAQYKSSIWNGETNLAIAMRADGDYFVLLNNFQKKLYVISVPQNTVVNYQNSQEYTLNAIWELGKIDKNQNSLYLKAMQSLFGYPVHVIYENENINLNNFDIRMSDIFFGKTNLSIFDYIKIKSKTYKIVKRSLLAYVKPKTYKIRDEPRLLFDEAQLDNDLSNLYEDINLSNLGYRVQIQVLDNEQAQEESISRLVNNVGWKVADIKYIAGTKNQTQCVLKIKSKFEEMIKNIFECQVIYQNKSLYDLVIVAGKEL